jgi:hypothetical protein
LRLPLREGAVHGVGQRGVAQQRRHVAAQAVGPLAGGEQGARGGVGAQRGAVGGKHQQRVGQAFHDGLVGAAEPAHHPPALGQVTGEAGHAVGHVPRRREQRGLKRRRGSPRRAQRPLVLLAVRRRRAPQRLR